MLQWKQTKDGSTALLIEGARRIGKSYIAVEFARNPWSTPERRKEIPIVRIGHRCTYEGLRRGFLLVE